MRQESEQQIQFALNNMPGAIQYILDAEKKHPNRIDIVQNSMSERNHQNLSAQKETPATPMSATFGAPSQPMSAFGAPSMGAPNGAFGQPSTLGSKPNPFATQPALRLPSFGAPSQSGGSGAFSQPSALGQKPNPFSAPSGGAFSSVANSGNAFAQTPQPASNPFAQPPSQPSNPFAQNFQPAPFGAPSPVPKNPFAATPTPQPPTRNPFTAEPKIDPFTSAAADSFKPAPNGAASINPFGEPAPAAAPSFQPAAPGAPSQHPPLSSYATSGPGGRLATFKGRRVIYKDGQPGYEGPDRTWQKIWFPNGAPPINKDSEMEDAMYDDQSKAGYVTVQQTGTFPGNVMPMVPPKQEWCLWDF